MKKGKGLTTFLLVLVFLAGLSLLLYPSLSNYWNSMHESRVISAYAETVANLDREEFDRMWQEAVEYNESLNRFDKYTLSGDRQKRYEELLNIGGSGVMGYIEIPSIEVTLPIYHGTSDGVLQVAVGHLDWTSLPVGGIGSHCVLSGHRGLPSAKLFTNLDELREGDVFMLRVLDEILTYEVDRILIVEPSDVSDLLPVAGKDYCTLVTCTPYGINTHRLLVRGHRIETEEAAAAIRVTADAIQIEEMLVAPVLALPILLVLLIILLIRPNRKKDVDSSRIEVEK